MMNQIIKIPTEIQLIDLPNEIQIKIFENYNIEDIKKDYFKLKCVKPILDLIIKKRKYDFIGKFELILNTIVFNNYVNGNNKLFSHKERYDGILNQIYKNQDLSLEIWKKKCEKYNFNLDYMPKILQFVLKEYRFKLFKRTNGFTGEKIDETDYFFLNSLIEYLNH
jgi:hypothetical protein